MLVDGGELKVGPKICVRGLSRWAAASGEEIMRGVDLDVLGGVVMGVIGPAHRQRQDRGEQDHAAPQPPLGACARRRAPRRQGRLRPRRPRAPAAQGRHALLATRHVRTSKVRGDLTFANTRKVDNLYMLVFYAYYVIYSVRI